MRNRIFTAPNGVQRTLWFRDGTNDESTLIATFEEDEYKVLERFKGGDAVIDLGAHIGGVTMLLSTLDPMPKIIAVEPLPENCEILRRSADQNGINVTLFEAAIVPVTTEQISVYYGLGVHKFVGQENLTSSKEYATKRKCVKVPTIDLGFIFGLEHIKECGFLKIDIEGAEEDIFKSLPQNALDKIKVIVGEYHNQDFDKFFPFKDQYEITHDLQEFYCRRK